MDRTRVRELTQILLRAKVDGDLATQAAAREELARAAAELAPEIRATVRARISAVMASTGNDNT